MFMQKSEFSQKNIFSKNQCAQQWKTIQWPQNTQQCLSAMLEKWKRSVYSGKAFGALLTLDCLDHEPLIAKLNAYGFSQSAVRVIHDFLSHRKQNKS